MLSTLFLASSFLLLHSTASPASGVKERAAKVDTINSTVEQGIQTECKTCPYSLCTNKVAYEYDTSMVLTCWTQGTPVNGDDTWLKTTDGCYVTQWDLVEYNGDYTKDLPYCGKIAQRITKTTSKTVYNTECNLVPSLVGPENHVKMYKPHVPLTVTCHIADDSTDQVLGNPTWYKTLSNCYVPTAQTEAVDNAKLDDCGPVPFMEKKMREPDLSSRSDARSSDIKDMSWRSSTTESRSITGNSVADLARRWLYTTAVGFDDGVCTEKPTNGSKVIKTYQYGTHIILQCATYGGTNIGTQAGTIWLLTTDFCFIKDDLTDPQLVDDEVRSQRYPACEAFVDTAV